MRFKKDFTMERGGHEMVLSGEPPILRTELEQVELQMLLRHSAPGLLPVHWFELNGQISFHYSLTGRRMLLHRLQGLPVGMKDYYSLLLAVVEALDGSKHYLLREEAFILHEDYIFVGSSWEELGLVYVPVHDHRLSQRSVPVNEQLLALAVRWSMYVQPLQGSGLQQILQELQQSVRYDKLRKLLLDLLSESSEMKLQEYAMDSIPPLPSPAMQPMSYSEPALEKQEGMQQNQLSARRNWSAAAICLLVIALIWRYGYAALPSYRSAALCTGATLLAAAAFVLWRIAGSRASRAGSSFVQMAAPTPIVKNEAAASMAQQEQRYAERWKLQDDHDHYVGNANFKGSELDTPGSQLLARPGFVQSESNHITGKDATVLLAANDESVSPQLVPASRQFYFERIDQETGAQQEIPLQQGSLVIGRAEANSGYVDQSPGLSRSHLEVSLHDELCTAKDLGSRNGSLLNDSMMIPYKEYSLQTGDEIRLAGRKGPLYRLSLDANKR